MLQRPLKLNSAHSEACSPWKRLKLGQQRPQFQLVVKPGAGGAEGNVLWAERCSLVTLPEFQCSLLCADSCVETIVGMEAKRFWKACVEPGFISARPLIK